MNTKDPEGRWRVPVLGRALLVAALGLAPWCLCAAGVAGSETFHETLDVVTVEVPVYVVREGAPVRDLTADSFELYDDGKKVVVTGFDVVDLEDETPPASGRVPGPGPQAPLAARRHFLLLFDLSFSEPGATIKARDAAIEMVMNDMRPRDLVAVAGYTLSGGARLVLGFSPDRRQVVAAIRRLGDPQLFERTGDPLKLVLDLALGAGVQGSLTSTGSNQGGVGGRVDTDAIQLQNLRELQRESGKAQRNVEMGRITAFLNSFGELAQILGTVEGKKHVILLSEGWNSALLVGSYNAQAQMQQAEAAARGAVWEVSSEERMGQSAELNFLDRILEMFRRADAIIQAVDIGGLRKDAISGGKAGSDNSLFMLADGTGGELYRNFNDLGDAMGQLLDRTSVTYLLSFQPTKLAGDGSYHKLKVKLKNVRKARAVSRPGYFEPKRFAQMTAIERQLDAADFIVSGENSGGLAAEALATPLPGRDGKAYVPIVIEVDGKSLLAEQPDQKMAGLELYAYAFDAAGGAQDFFSQNMGLDLAKVRPVLEQSGLKFFGHVDLVPGRYLLRVLVRDARTGRYAARALPLEVPDFGAAQAFLSPPLFPEPLGKWLMVRENKNRRDASLPYPFMADGQPYVPAAAPRLGPSGQDLHLMAFGLGEGPLALEGWVLGGDGQRLDGARLALVKQQSAASGGLLKLVARVDAPGLAPGDYTLVINVRNQSGSELTSTGRIRSSGGP